MAALFVETNGVYSRMPDVELWDERRDARRYDGPYPVVAHPPCNLWVNMAAQNWSRYGKVKPAWYPGGNDRGCFASALSSVIKHGGVLEHPAFTHAWAEYYIQRPPKEGGWRATPEGVYVCEVWQSAYGHKARKRTWLLYSGVRAPFELNWAREVGTHQIGWFDRKKPTLSKKEAIATPPAFAEALVALARHAK